MKITVVGTGYVGLVTGTCLSDVGIDVTCVDIDQKKIDGLKNGIMPTLAATSKARPLPSGDYPLSQTRTICVRPHR